MHCRLVSVSMRCCASIRTVANDNTVRFNGSTLQLLPYSVYPRKSLSTENSEYV